MAIRWKLREVEDQLIKDLMGTTILSSELANKYGVSRQAISEFCKRRKIKRQKIKRPKREHTKECPICQGLIRIAGQDHSDFISLTTIKEQLKVDSLRYHIGILRKKGLISERFGRLKSRKAEQAYRIYFSKRLPVKTIGRQVGLHNFSAVIKQHRARGWDVPDPLFKYDANERAIRLRMFREKRRKRGVRG